LIFAFVLSGISPACAFISGKFSSIDIEICTEDGLKTVSMPGDEAPDDHAHKKKDDCGFCFAQSHLKSAKADGASLSFFQPAFQTRISYDRSVRVKRTELSALAARAPPSLN